MRHRIQGSYDRVVLAASAWGMGASHGDHLASQSTFMHALRLIDMHGGRAAP